MANIYKRDFKRTLRTVPKLSRKERKYTQEQFSRALRGGLNRGELKKEIRRLNKKTGDNLDRRELDRIERKLSSKM